MLQAAIALTLEQGIAPSIPEVARAVGLTKQGVLHYFPSRAALDEAVLFDALDRVDREMTAAALPAVMEAVTRWQSMIAEELGDPVRAQVVRLVGDGLFGESLVTGEPRSADLLDELVAHLILGAPASRS